MAPNSWTRDQTIVALNLYWKIPYNQISGSSNLLVREIAGLIGKTSGSLAFKLMNLSSLDDDRQNKGKLNSSKLDREIWQEFYQKWELLSQENARVLLALNGGSIDAILAEDALPKHGLDRLRSVKTRINQHEFRSRVLASYGSQCCITGLATPELLVASHIVPWSQNMAERLNPQNGLCLNALHDKAFDRGLMTISQNFKIKIASNYIHENESQYKFFAPFDGQSIQMPLRFKPNLEFLQFHEQNIFKG